MPLIVRAVGHKTVGSNTMFLSIYCAPQVYLIFEGGNTCNADSECAPNYNLHISFPFWTRLRSLTTTSLSTTYLSPQFSIIHALSSSANSNPSTLFTGLKQCVIYQAYTLGYSSTQIAIELNIDLRTVQRVRKLYSEIGEVCKDCMYMGRPPLMSMGATKVCTVRICQMCIYSSC
jgi:hypothetical protein